MKRFLSVLLAALLTLSAFAFLTSCDDSEDKVGTADSSEAAVSFNDPGFGAAMSNLFGKPAAQITAAELASVKYLYISFYDEKYNVNIGFDEYLAAETFDDKNAVLKRASVSEIKSLKDLKYFTGLKEFGTYEVYFFDSFSLIKEARGLEVLDITTESKNAALKSLSGIEKLKGLRELSIYGAVFSDISDIGALTELESLYIGADYRLYEDEDVCFSDISCLSELKKLESLSINYCAASTVEPLKGLPLKHLSMIRCGLSDISALSTLESLEEAVLIYNAIEDITPLTKLPKLKNINLDYNYITDVSPFSVIDPENVNYITMDMNSVEDWTPVRHLYEAEKLYVGYELYFD